MKTRSVTLLSFGSLLAFLIATHSNIGLADIFNSPTASNPVVADQSHSAANTDKQYSSKLTDFPINIYAQVEANANVNTITPEAEHCKALVYRTLSSLPKEPVNKLKNLTLIFSDTARRGLGGGSTILLRCRNVTDEELVGVLVHEMGHIMDTGVLIGSAAAKETTFKDGATPIYENDTSSTFYKLSFNNAATLKNSAADSDFVSGYAKSDVFEDFAETYAYYVLHGDEFRKLINTNKTLNSKYFFMKYFVFGGKEFINGDANFNGNTFERNYDVTILSYDLSKFFAV
jgi:hypothetical protein